MEEIRRIHKESHEIYGAPKIAEEMRKKGDAVSDTLEAKWVVEAIGKAKRARGVDKPKVMHCSFPVL